MIRIGWFSPISTQTGIAQYSKNVLVELKRLARSDEVQVVVFHPATSDVVVDMPYPTIELSESLIGSDFSALFDVAIYHLGNNDKNHGPIYAALRRHPGVVVMHDYVYQHYFAGIGVHGGFLGPSFGGLLHSIGGQRAFDFLADSGVLKADEGRVLYVPWDGQWATQFPLGDKLAELGSAAIVHSSYARGGLGEHFAGPTLQLFMPRPDEPLVLNPIVEGNQRIHIVCGGHIGSTKGLRLLTAAFSINPGLKSQFRVTIAGFGSDQTFLALLEEDIRDMGLASTFDLCIDPDDEDFAAVMAKADVFYNLRYPNTEGASLSLAEQMTFHRAVIAYRTGCFAEIPEDSCYFLDRIGDAHELADLLETISKNREGLKSRGDNAWKAVRENTASKYAESLLEFILQKSEQLKNRAELVHCRANMALPNPSPEDEVWLQNYVSSKILLDELFDNSLYLPEHLINCSVEEQSRYLLQNLLHTRVKANEQKVIEGVLAKKTPLEFYSLLGKLLRLAEQIVFNRTLLSPSLEELSTHSQDLDLWTIVLCLPPRMGVPMARALLAIPFEAVSDLQKNAERDGTAWAVSDYLQFEDAVLATKSTLGPLVRFLDKAKKTPLETIPIGTNLVEHLRTPDSTISLRTFGFHPIEPIGIWTASERASVDLNLTGETAATGLSLRASSLVNGQEVEIAVTEHNSDRRVAKSFTLDPGSDANPEPLILELPSFVGSLSVTFSCDKVQSPESLSISADTRSLGLLLSSITLI